LRGIGPDEQQVWQLLSDYLPDSLVALDWCIEHEEWEPAMRVIPAWGKLTERESYEMFNRLHRAAREGIRAGLPIPSDRTVSPPYLQLVDGGLSISDVDEFIDSLERWQAASPANRFAAQWTATRALANGGHLEALEEPLQRLAALTPELDSVWATRSMHELNGTVARVRGDWAGAAHSYGAFVEAGDGILRGWFDLVAAWWLLTARCLSEEQAVITGDELREPWRCCREQQIEVLQLHGVTSTTPVAPHMGDCRPNSSRRHFELSH